MAASYQDLKVWHKSMDLVVEIYKLIRLLPKDEVYSLSSQMRRAAVSAPSNIAEGQQRKSEKEFINFLSIAKGSVAELETQLLICVRLDLLNEEQINAAMDYCKEIGLMLSSLMKALET
jgi:four helix bundle protein